MLHHDVIEHLVKITMPQRKHVFSYPEFTNIFLYEFVYLIRPSISKACVQKQLEQY